MPRREHIPITLFIYPSAISNASYAMTRGQLKKLKDTSYVTIQPHTYWHPNVRTERKCLDDIAYAKPVKVQLEKSRSVLKAGLSIDGDVLGWPFGIHDPELEATEVGARTSTTVHDMRGLLADLQARGLCLNACIVVFKDELLAKARHDLAVKNADGSLFRDREGLHWADAPRREMWGYNLAIPEAAASLGFDEIQFDNVRFSDRRGISFSVPNTEANRVAAISGFIAEARDALRGGGRPRDRRGSVDADLAPESPPRIWNCQAEARSDAMPSAGRSMDGARPAAENGTNSHGKTG